MKKHTQSNHNFSISFTTRFLLFIILASMISSCGLVLHTPVPTRPNAESIQSEQALATQELTLVPPTEEATETAPSSHIKLNMENVIFPPIGYVKEYYEKGEYDSGLETIKQWVGVWGKMGIFEKIAIENSYLSPVPLDGRARIVCVRANEETPLLCPPLDLNNGGLKAVPEEGTWDETDMPLQVIFEEFEEIATKGSGNELVYQFIDKYSDKQTRYVDPKTGQIVEGKSLIRDVEVTENEVVKGSVVCVADDYCMGGQMLVDQEVGKVFYERLLDALVNSYFNKEYFNKLLNDNISIKNLVTYLEINNGIIPAGLTMPRVGFGAYVHMNYQVDVPINLSAIKTIVFGSYEWQNNVSGIRDFLADYDKAQLINPYSSTNFAWIYFGWYVDENGYIVLVNGSKDGDVWHAGVIGESGQYVPEHDNKAATGQILQFIKLMEKSDENGYALYALPFDNDPDDRSPSINEKDIQRLLGGKYLFTQAYD